MLNTVSVGAEKDRATEIAADHLIALGGGDGLPFQVTQLRGVVGMREHVAAARAAADVIVG